ncbi:uncharacterized protein LOC127845995 [Dreissena polymorpha]|uniref:uncharacterized protein LOC127845995 n=1 Tax=Dreissena polymorpha TaxID=45954 RepID=UPI002264AAE9|nr:uncharacterized protein LOC127845995 [Dreissena polymorpha]
MSVASERIRRDPDLMAPVRTTLNVGGVPHGNLHFKQGPPSQLSRRPSSAGRHFNAPMGLNPVIQKLPVTIQSKWINKAANYKETNCVAYPPFTVLTEFLESMAGRFNDPALVISDKQSQSDISEIPTPEVAALFSHLKPIKDKFPELMENPHIGLPIGRDIPEAHHVLEQVLGDQKQLPFAQKLPLGWVLVGEVCLGQLHMDETCENIRTFKTQVLNADRTTLLCPCQNALKVSEKINTSDDIFKVTKADDQVGLSQDDQKFLQIMDNTIDMRDGHWTAPLPLKNPQKKLPNNKLSVYKRATSLRASLQKNPVKQKQTHKFMQQILDSGAAEEAPPLNEDTERWYLPFFGVYHPRKPNKVRGVFDSSAVFDGNSLNNILLTGPNCTNSLLGVLLRFRRNAVAVMCDVQQLFYCFKVNKEHRDLLRFFWHKDNNPKKELIEYRMTVHVFGNSPSPAVATYCLRKAVETADEDVRTFVNRDFYEDDALTSHLKEEEAIDLIKRTQETLSRSSIRLYKIASNSRVVISSFPVEDLAIDMTSFDISTDEMPDQASLGLKWNTNADTFEFKINIAERPFT